MARKKGQKARTKFDRWKQVKWFKVKTPTEFNNKVACEIVGVEPEDIIGRVVRLPLGEIVGNFALMYIEVKFKVINVAGDFAETEFYGHELLREQIRAQVRRNRTRIDAIVDVTTKDNRKIRVRTMVVTARRCKTTQAKAIRKIMSDILLEEAKDSTFSEFSKKLVGKELQGKIRDAAHKIYPVKACEIIKSKILK